MTDCKGDRPTARREECNLHSVTVGCPRQTAFSVTLQKYDAGNYKSKINALCGSNSKTSSVGRFHIPHSTVHISNKQYKTRIQGFWDVTLCLLTFRRTGLPLLEPSNDETGTTFPLNAREHQVTRRRIPQDLYPQPNCRRNSNLVCNTGIGSGV